MSVVTRDTFASGLHFSRTTMSIKTKTGEINELQYSIFTFPRGPVMIWVTPMNTSRLDSLCAAMPGNFSASLISSSILIQNQDDPMVCAALTKRLCRKLNRQVFVSVPENVNVSELEARLIGEVDGDDCSPA